MSLIPSYEKVVTGFTINSGGSNYASPTIDIEGGGGTGATAEATVVGGKITAITITNQGSGYSTPPTVTVVGGGGTGADIDAIIGDLPYKNKLEFLIQEQLPEFVQNEYAGFVTFLEGYYRFLDQSGEVNNFLLNARDYSDVDTTLEVFIDQFRKQYAVDIPKNVLVNQRRLVKLIGDFYESKGAEDSIELLFKILYDETVEFFYPSTHILKASDGVWIEDVVIRILGEDGVDPFDLSGTICKLVYSENTGVKIFPKTIETTVSSVKKLAYTSPAIYELNVSLPKNSPLKVPGAGGSAVALVADGQIKAIVGETSKTFSSITTAGTLVATVATSGTSGQFTCGNSSLAVGDRLTITGTPGVATLAATVAVSGTAGQFTCGASTLAVNDRVRITGTKGGTATITGYTTGTTYRVSAVTGTSPNVTGFTLTTESGTAIVTTAGTLTGLTYTTTGTITGYTTGTTYRVSAVTGTSPNVTGFTLTTQSNVPLVTTAGKLSGLTYVTATGIDLTNNTIKISSHGYSTGDVVVYDKDGGTIVTGLTNYATYFVIAVDVNTIKLAASAGNATLGTAVDLTVVGSGSHILYDPVTDGGSGYYAAPTVILNDTVGSGAVLRANLVNGSVSSITVIQGGSGYIEDAENIQVVFSTESIRTQILRPLIPATTTTVAIPETLFGYVIRQLSTVTVVSCEGEGVGGDCGFRVGQIYQIDEQEAVGSYVKDPPMSPVSAGLISAIAANPTDYGTYDASIFNAGVDQPFFDPLTQYTLVSRDNRASVRISSIDAGGCVTAVTIFNTGFDFEQEEFEATITSPNGCEAVLAFTTGAVLIKTGRFKDSRGMLSNINKLQDNYYYQNYSYVIKSGVTSGTWLPLINKTVHPAGMAVFGELLITQTIDMVDYIGVLEILVLNEFFIDVIVLNDTTRSVHFYKVLTDTATGSIITYAIPDYVPIEYASMDADSLQIHFYKVLGDSVTLSDATELLFDVGIYNPADDTTSIVDSFDRVVQYVRVFNEAFYATETSVVDFGKTVVEDPVWVTRDFWAEIDYSGTEFAWNPEETIEVDFAKVLADAANATESQAFVLSKPLTDTTTNSDTFTRTVEYYRTFTESVITNEYANAGIEKPDQVDVATAAETSTNHLYKSLTDSITSTDLVGVIPYLVKTDNAGATELLIVANDSATIESIAAAEESLITVLKGIFETVAVTEDGIINVQNYIDGDFGSDYAGQSMTFAGTNSSFPVPNSILNLDASNSLSYTGTGTTWFDMTANDLDASLTNMSYTDPYFTFNGTNATASIADNALLEPGTGDFTLEAWVYYSTIAGSPRTFISKTNNGGGAADWSYGLRTNPAGATYIEVGNGTTSVTSPSYTVSTGQWYHIVGVWTNVASNSIALYINGVSQGSNSHSFTSVKNSTNPLYLGSYNGGEYPQWFDGRISAVRYYNTALTAGEVTQNFTALRGRFNI